MMKNGFPVHNDTKLFEFLILEGAQAGLSWTTILKKRKLSKAIDNFNVNKIVNYDEKKLLNFWQMKVLLEIN